MNQIERERPELTGAIYQLLVDAFPTDAEACLVDDLRTANALSVSLVCSAGDELLGYIGFSPVSIESPAEGIVIWGLAPLAVAPAAQRQGIGSALIRAGLQACADAGCNAVVVLGAPKLYGLQGFGPASTYGLRCIYDAPPEAFMLAELRPGAFPFHAGVVHYHRAFDRFAPTR